MVFTIAIFSDLSLCLWPNIRSVTAPVTHRIALCHEWVTTWGGSEQVAAQIATALDVPDVFTFTADPVLARRLFGERRVHTSRLGASSFAAKNWSLLLPLMSRWWRSLNLEDYDALVTCSHSTVNSVRAHPDAVHVSYCCTPMRYAWTWRAELDRVPAPLRPLWPAAAAVLRRGDRRRAENVDIFLAVSHNVARRIDRFYGKPSLVLYPPVDTDFFTPDPSVPREDFYLSAGRLVPYKRVELAVHAATQRGLRLIVAGSGPQLPYLQRLAGPTVDFVAKPSREALRDLYRRAKALVFPGIEDFGIVLVEAQACGTPIVAFADGGVLETVRDEVTGHLYTDDSVGGLADVLSSFDHERYDPDVIRQQALRFRPERFEAAIRSIMTGLLDASASRSQTIRELLTAPLPGQ